MNKIKLLILGDLLLDLLLFILLWSGRIDLRIWVIACVFGGLLSFVIKHRWRNATTNLGQQVEAEMEKGGLALWAGILALLLNIGVVYWGWSHNQLMASLFAAFLPFAFHYLGEKWFS
ncbi:MAG: hypothetical protein FWF59_01465 [Turicibacter sp.]|nr:hypothetical protein [Turicibacter sp.]